MRNSGYPLDGKNEFFERYACACRVCYSSENVLNIVLAEELHRKAYRVAARGNDREFSSAVGDRDIGGAPVVALAESVEDGVFVLRSFRTDKLIVAVKVYFSAGSLNAVSKFKLGVDHVFDRAECFKVLRADRGYDTVIRVSDTAKFFYLVDSARTHFADEILMCRLQIAPYRYCNSHGSVETLGSFQRLILRRKEFTEVEFHACFAVASRDTYRVERGH